jgi:hypothetical protein
MATIDHERMLAYLRAHVTLRLLTHLPADDVRLATTGRLTIGLLTPGGPACQIRIADGRVRFYERPKTCPSITLFFPRPADLVKTLAGGKARVFPLPSSVSAVRAVRAFRALTSRLQERFADDTMRPHLLLLATLFGVEEVGNRDPYVAAHVKRIPEGAISVRIAGDGAGWVQKSSGLLRTGSGDLPPGVERANAELEFADRNAAIDLLTGACPAMLALAERRVRLYGRLPMIQNLFPVLDRVSDYLSDSRKG